MKFKDFLNEHLDQRRGFHSQLAEILDVAKSTITAWRHGATPDFGSCLKLADYFHLDPLEVFEMLDEANYTSVYLRFVGAERTSTADHKASSVQLTEEDLYPDGRHAGLHRDLQRVLEAASGEASAIATMIRMAAQQVRTRGSQSEPRPADPVRPVGNRLVSVYRTLRTEQVEDVHEGATDSPGLPLARHYRLQES